MYHTLIFLDILLVIGENIVAVKKINILQGEIIQASSMQLSYIL